MRILRFILFPFSIVYNIITFLRNKLFDYEILKATSFDVPVLAVGNLSVGGTGKTPQIEYLVRLLQKNYNVAVLSRGYKRKTKGFQLLNNSHTALDVGDEPLQFFKKFEKIIVAVDADRTNGIKKLLEIAPKIDVVLLDDAFQHRKVKAGFYILLTKYNDLYTNDFLLPTGNLRENRAGAKRANVIIVTKCPEDLPKRDQDNIEKNINALPNQKVFFTSISYDKELKGARKLAIDNLKGKEIVLVTGIANPTPLINYLNSNKISFKHLKFQDHHNFTKDDLEKIKDTFDKVTDDAKIILTTEKDFVRLEKSIKNIHYIAIESVFLNRESEFVSEIESFVKR